MTKKNEKISNSAKLLGFWGDKKQNFNKRSQNSDFWGVGNIFEDFGEIMNVSTEFSSSSRQKWRIRMVSEEYHDMDVFQKKAEENGYQIDQMSIDTSQNHDPIFRMGSRFVQDLRPIMRQIEYDMVLTEILI